MYTMQCPECTRFICRFDSRLTLDGNPPEVISERLLVFPNRPSARPLPPEVPEPYRTDFDEAASILALSAQASAALSRKCLQTLLREEANAMEYNLSDQIDAVLAANSLPSDIANDLDAIRAIGNFATHPHKSTATGEVLPVEPGEADWSLDTLQALLDFYFVRPAQTQARRDAYNRKLAEAGKGPLKEPGE
jgi:hypothetical protein